MLAIMKRTIRRAESMDRTWKSISILTVNLMNIHTDGISITISKKEVTFRYTLIVQNYLTINYITRQPL
jgi:hypothetical protein